MKHVFLFIVISSSFFASAQDLEWLVHGGGIKSDKGTTIVTDDQGNSYITGYYNEEANFGPLNTGFSFAQSKEVYVVKIDPQGNYVWQTHGLNYYDDRGLGLTIDAQGNVFVTGTCWGGLDWAPLSVYNSTQWSDQIFVTKIDNNGNVVWMKNAGNDYFDSFLYNDDHGQDLATDVNGNIFVTGFISNYWDSPQPATFDNIVIDLQPYDSLAFIAKMNPQGDWQWVKTFGGIYDHRDNGIAVDHEGNVYVTGGFIGNQDFSSENITSAGGTDIYVTKYDTDGNFIWVRQAGGALDDRANGLVDGHDGFMYVTGEFRDVSTFGALTIDNAGGPKGRDAFVAKISKNGDWKWVRRAGSKKGKDRGNCIASNNQGNIFVTGQYSSEADFGNLTLDSSGDSVQIFVAAIDTAGIWRWVLEGGGNEYDRGQGIATDENCNVYVTGYFDNYMTFMDTTIQPNQGKDIFTLKLSDACFGYSSSPPPTPEDEPEICNVLVSNVFTPNNDNLNDVITFTTYCNTKFNAVIMNRWGNVVFETDDPNTQWDGRNQSGMLVAEGVYFYRISVDYENEEDKFLTGFINVAR